MGINDPSDDMLTIHAKYTVHAYELIKELQENVSVLGDTVIALNKRLTYLEDSATNIINKDSKRMDIMEERLARIEKENTDTQEELCKGIG